jgi:ankyrin repeat protein
MVSLPSCKALVQHSAKVNEMDSKLRTPLLLAYMHGHVRVAHYLWDRGADPAMSYGYHTSLFEQALRVRFGLTASATLCCSFRA